MHEDRRQQAPALEISWPTAGLGAISIVLYGHEHDGDESERLEERWQAADEF